MLIKQEMFGQYFFVFAVEEVLEEADVVTGDVGYAALFCEYVRENVFLLGFGVPAIRPGPLRWSSSLSASLPDS